MAVWNDEDQAYLRKEPYYERLQRSTLTPEGHAVHERKLGGPSRRDGARTELTEAGYEILPQDTMPTLPIPRPVLTPQGWHVYEDPWARDPV